MNSAKKKHVAKPSDDCSIHLQRLLWASREEIWKQCSVGGLINCGGQNLAESTKIARTNPNQAAPICEHWNSHSTTCSKSYNWTLSDFVAQRAISLARKAAVNAVTAPRKATDSWPSSCAANLALTKPFMYAAQNPNERFAGARSHHNWVWPQGNGCQRLVQGFAGLAVEGRS